MVNNPYEILGVSQSASMDEIKRAYRKKARENHPDLHPDDPKATEKMQQVNEAYDMLCNPDKYRAQRQARPNPGQYGGANYGRPPYGETSGQGRAYQGGGWQYTYYSSAGSDSDAWKRWQEAWNAQQDGQRWQEAWDEQQDGRRQRSVVFNPFRGVLRFVGWMLIIRFLLSLFRFGFFI